jgi:hypothetical protein
MHISSYININVFCVFIANNIGSKSDVCIAINIFRYRSTFIGNYRGRIIGYYGASEVAGRERRFYKK